MKSDGRRDFSEWEDNVLFDADDPDFCGTLENGIRTNAPIITVDGTRITSNIHVLNSLLFNGESNIVFINNF